jgi:endonuclease YncB( thermonuclease family)
VIRSRLARVALCLSLAFAPLPSVAQEDEIVPPPSRDVTPPGVTPAPAGSGPLVREYVPPPPVSEPMPAPPVREPVAASPVREPLSDPLRWHRFILPETTDAATFVVHGRSIRIAGVLPPPRSATCRNAADEDWPCGDVALEALRHFLLGRPVECSFLGADTSDPLIAPCRVGRTDLGSWLLRQGWAKAAGQASPQYRQAAYDARCADRGVWHGTDERAACMAIREQPEPD